MIDSCIKELEMIELIMYREGKKEVPAAYIKISGSEEQQSSMLETIQKFARDNGMVVE